MDRNWKSSGLNIKAIREWCHQFEDGNITSEEAQLQFLFLLSKFMYFGQREISEMLRAIYRDLFKCKAIHDIRRKNSNTLEQKFLVQEFEKVLSRTRFLGIGNPSESGTYLLYRFRQENKLGKGLFISSAEIFKDVAKTDANGKEEFHSVIADPNVDNYIFIDDLTCSGDQAEKYSKKLIPKIKALKPDANVSYFVLVATDTAIKHLEAKSAFDEVNAVFKLDHTFKCFDKNSRYYSEEDIVFDRTATKKYCEQIDFKLEGPGYELGFDRSQLLLGFEHNTPDNVPPVFWSEGKDGNPWKPVFKRYHKKY